MGKRIIQQARGHGSSTYRVIKLINSSAHTAPLAKIKYDEGTFFMPAFKNMFEGQKINFDGKVEIGNIVKLGGIPIKTQIYNIESRPGDGGKFMKTGGSSATISKTIGEHIFVLFPSKKERKFNKNCRAVIGAAAGTGRADKPFVKAGKKYHLKKAKSKLWPRTSAVKMNAIDHPFGSGRAKNPKSKVAKRNSPPGRKVGLIRPKRTGKRK